MRTLNPDIGRELAQLAAGTMRTPHMLEASRRAMAFAQGSQWSQAAAFNAHALYALGRLAEADQLVEEAWQLADRFEMIRLPARLLPRSAEGVAPAFMTIHAPRRGTGASLIDPARGRPAFSVTCSSTCSPPRW